MVTLLITSVLILGLVAVAIYFWQKPANIIETNELPPATLPRALFSDIQPVAELAAPETDNHEDLLARARAGDLSALIEASSTDVYSDVLNIAVKRVSAEAVILDLASFVAQHNLPVNGALADAMMRCWETRHDRLTTAKMLHVAALSDDAEVYRKAIELALSFWRDGRLPDMSATELRALFNSEFWLLSTPVRNSGTGFVLKRTLSSARRELEGTTNN